MPDQRYLYASTRFGAYLDGGITLASPLARPRQGGGSIAPCSPQSDLPSAYLRGLDRLTRRELGAGIMSAGYPGGPGRDSITLSLDDGRHVVATRRGETARAVMEHDILSCLSSAGAPCPAPLFFNGTILLQEWLDGPRLSEQLARPSEAHGAILADALDGLARLHEAGSAAGLDTRTPIIGADEIWLEGLLDRPAVIGQALGVPCPEPDLDALFDLFICVEPRFVRWDARPGNAIVTPNGPYWFDFEHAGARRRLDDLVWLLADENVPVNPAVEDALLEAALPAFADDLPVGEALGYALGMGVFHCCVRLGLLLDEAEDAPELSERLARDRVVASRENALRLCARGARWSADVPATRRLAPWFQDIADIIEDRGLTLNAPESDRGIP